MKGLIYLFHDSFQLFHQPDDGTGPPVRQAPAHQRAFHWTRCRQNPPADEPVGPRGTNRHIPISYGQRLQGHDSRGECRLQGKWIFNKLGFILFVPNY